MRFLKAQDRQHISYPLGFSWTDAPISVYRNLKGEITTDFDVANFKITGAGQTYYVRTDGNDANDGLSEANALRAIQTAVAKADCLTVMVKAGVYHRTRGFINTANTDKKINVIGYDGDVYLTTHDLLAWSKTGGYTNVYQMSRTNVGAVIDHSQQDAYGDDLRLTRETSIANVDANPGTFYQDGALVYAHTHDSRVPDTDMWVCLITGNIYFDGESELYLENLKVYGGRPLDIRNITAADGIKVYAKNCEFKYADNVSNTNGVSINGAELAIFQDCICSKNWLDGFNYTDRSTVVTKAIEIDCKAWDNGFTSSDNGSTQHEGGKIIRVNGEYFDNPGPNVIDVNADTESWNIGCVAYNDITPLSLNNFAVGQATGAAKMWLDSCFAHGGDIRVGVESTLYVRNNILSDDLSAVDGTVVEY